LFLFLPFKGAHVASSIANPTVGTRVNPERSLELALAAAGTAIENRGQEVQVMDVRAQTSLFDYFVLATGSSRRQLHAMSEEIDHTLEDDLNDKRMGIEGYQESRWIVLDYGSIVVHLFDEESRQFYDLENLWAGAKLVDITELRSRAQ
jgi:ribosome-associated protein